MVTPGGLCKPSEMEGLGILWASIDPRLRWAPHLKPDWCRTFSREVPVPLGFWPLHGGLHGHANHSANDAER